MAGGALHPVQQAMVECHGSQCGFCTPGFVMSLLATYEQHHGARGTRPTRQQLADELSGNLCRCTGYRPILDAGAAHVRAAGRAARHRAGRARRSQALRADATLRTTPRRRRRARSRRARSTSSPRCALAQPEARLLAGSTDIGLWVNKQFRDAAAT